MDTQLITVSAATWVFWGCLLAVRQRVEQMYAAGFGSGDTSFLKVINVANGLVLINFIIFFFVYGFKHSWLHAAAIVVGGYLICFAFIALLRLLGLNLGFINFLARVGLVAMPAGAIGMWLLA